jgi:hypothetical protein
MADSTVLAKPQAGSAAALVDCLVLLDGSAEDEIRLAHAEVLAAPSGVRIIGLFANLLPEPIAYSAEFGAVAIAELAAQTRQDGDRLAEGLARRFTRLGVPNELRRLDAFAASLPNLLATELRTADLLVASLPRGGDVTSRWRAAIERALFESGRGVYLVPPGLPPRASLRTALIGWTDTREAARALAEALPLIKGISRVEIATVRELRRNRMGGSEVLADIAAHLARHGVAAETAVLPDDTDAAFAPERMGARRRHPRHHGGRRHSRADGPLSRQRRSTVTPGSSSAARSRGSRRGCSCRAGCNSWTSGSGRCRRGRRRIGQGFRRPAAARPAAPPPCSPRPAVAPDAERDQTPHQNRVSMPSRAMRRAPSGPPRSALLEPWPSPGSRTFAAGHS